MNRLWAMAMMAVLFCWTGSADASADSTCYPKWKVKHTDLTGCSSMAILSPGNDSRVNLLMLLQDRHEKVGPAGRYGYDIPERRGDAEPFGYSVFATALAPPATGTENEEAASFPWGTRCMSNMAASADFLTELARAKKISIDERATLAAVRTMLNPQCIEGDLAAGLVRQGLSLVKSKQGLAFARYLIGAAAFYDGEFAGAKDSFSDIGKSGSPWLSEAASYMLGRVALNAAMAGAFDEYGSLVTGTARSDVLNDAEAGFRGYLAAYPNGRYAPSARGLLRRVYWLGKQHDRLLAEYVAQFAQKDATKRNMSLPDLVQEFDIKLLSELKPEEVSDPMLLAVADLRAMRHDGDPKIADYDGPPITRSALDEQRDRFSGHGTLYSYVIAVHAFYVDNNPADVLALIEENPGETISYLGFSRQLLRALASDALSLPDTRQALVGLVQSAKLPFQRGTAELALAMHDERHKKVEAVFAINSPIGDPDIREMLLRYHAGPALLRQRHADPRATQRERDVALFVLLYKDITRGAYGDFLLDVKKVPRDARPQAPDDYQSPPYTDVARFRWASPGEFACPGLAGVASTLSVKPNDPHGILCLGEFIRMNGFDPDFYGITRYLDSQPDSNELGGTPTAFLGTRFSRLEGYKSVMRSPSSQANDKAYALYRAVYCFAPSGNNGCDESEIPQSQRKAWFQRLKTEFPQSPWAKRINYYW
ncbi:MAG: hypothetical protein WBO17_15175 [Sphingorhabdus sp.]